MPRSVALFSKMLGGILTAHIDQPPLFAPLRQSYPDLFAPRIAEPFGQQLPIGNLAVKGDNGRHIPSKRIVTAQKFCTRLVGLFNRIDKKMLAIAKLALAEVKHLKAGAVVGGGKGDNVLLANRRFHHLLLFAHLAKGVYLISKPCRTLKFQPLSRLLHLVGQAGYGGRSAVAEVIERACNRLGIGLGAYFRATGGTAKPDVVIQAGTAVGLAHFLAAL